MQVIDKRLFEQLVKKRPHLWWWVKNKEDLSIESVVHGVLSYGDMDEVDLLFQLAGRENVKKIFLQQISRARHNYRIQTINFFKKVFAQDV